MTSQHPDPIRQLSETELLNPTQVARLFRVDPTTAIRWAVEKRLPAIKSPSGRWLFPAGPVRKFITDQLDQLSGTRNG